MADKTDLTIETFSDLDKLAMTNHAPHRDVVFGVATTLCFENGHEVDRRLAGLRVLQDYAEQYPDLVNSWHPPGARSTRFIKDADILETYRDCARTDNDRAMSNAAVYAQATARDSASASASLHTGSLMWNSKGKTRWSDVLLTESAKVLEGSGLDQVVNRTLKWCEMLRPDHGTFGLSLIPHFGSGAPKFATLAWPVIQRYPGFDWPDVGTWSVRVGNHLDPGRCIRTVNWLTVLDDGLVERLGGRMAMEKELGEDCPIHDYDGGVVIQAGPEPQLGDVNAGDIPEPYRTVAHLSKPLSKGEESRNGWRGLIERRL